MVSSGVIHTTFLVHTVCALPELYEYYLQFVADVPTSTLHLMTSLLWFAGLLAETMILSFADKRPDAELLKSPNQSPELHCSFLNRLLLWWLNPLPRLGARKSLVVDDLFHLNHRSTSDHLVPLWEHYWVPTIKGRRRLTISRIGLTFLT